MKSVRFALGLSVCSLLVACSSAKDDVDQTTNPADAGDGATDSALDSASNSDGADTGLPEPRNTQGTCGATQWALAFGGGEKAELLKTEAASSVVSDASGKLFATGRYHGAIDFGGGPLVAGADNRSLFVVKLDPNGAQLKSRGFGDPSDGVIYSPQASGNSLALTSTGGVVVGGAFAGSVDFGTGVLESVGTTEGACIACFVDGFVLKLDQDFQTEWVLPIGDVSSDTVFDVAVGAADVVYVTGSFEGTLNLGGTTLTSGGKADAFVAKLAGDGSVLWVKQIGGAEDATGLSVLAVADGVIVGGQFAGALDIGSLVASGESNGFLLKLDVDGNLVFGRTLGEVDRGSFLDLAPTSNGSFVTAGFVRGVVTLAGTEHTTEYTDAFVLALDAAGNDLWGRVFGTYENDDASAVAVSASGGVVVTGTLGVGTADLGGGPLSYNLFDGAFVLELDENGEHLCSRRHSADSTGEIISPGVELGGGVNGQSVAFDPSGRVLLAGDLAGKGDFGSGLLTSSGGVDALFVSFAPSGK